MSEKKYAWTAINSNSLQRLEIESMDWSEDKAIGEKAVLLTQRAGSMHFHFSMTPTQAREMAMALIAAAEALA